MHEPGAEEPFKDLPRPEVSPEFPSTKELAKVEVKEYEGERLDSFRDIRDLSIKGPQDVDRASYRLVVTGMVDNRLELPYDDVLKYPSYSKVVTLYCVTGWDATILWEGILLEDLIADAKPRPDVNTVIFTAADGYTTSLPLDYIRDNDILLAYKVNNVTLPPDKGFPFEVVAESKWGYKWIKWVTKIELSNDPTYEGYWESRGYPNDAAVER
ncbi:TPA: molybdopterin-dependent oxidoreductase [Candidatus Woesearchaeota archaeon]|nr:molybdopterin-dependent oxidoreductase [Candidatus Woesearchaeota archaeon]